MSETPEERIQVELDELANLSIEYILSNSFELERIIDGLDADLANIMVINWNKSDAQLGALIKQQVLEAVKDEACLQAREKYYE